MKQFQALVGAVGALFIFNSLAWAQPPQLPEPLYAENFEQSVGTWVGIGAGSQVSMERAPENAKQGGASLRFNYQVVPGQMNILASPFAPRSLSTLQSISFWVKADHNTSLALTLQEQGGGRFGTVFSVTKDQWQRVELAPSEFILQVGKDDPKDDNGQLDLDKIEGFALLDFTQLLAQLAADPNNPLVRLLGIQTGPRTLYLDDFALSSQPQTIAAGANAPADNSLLDAFQHPQAEWSEVGDLIFKTLRPEMEPAQPGKVRPSNMLQVEYTQATGKVAAFAKLLPAGILTGKTNLSFVVTSRRHATMIVQLEEKSGGKYNAVLEIPGQVAPPDPDVPPIPQTLSFADFKAADDSKDDNNHLDLDQVKQLLFIDASGMLGADTGQNTLWLSQLRAK